MTRYVNDFYVQLWLLTLALESDVSSSFCDEQNGGMGESLTQGVTWTFSIQISEFCNIP
jgi:hypothetical protein